MSKIKLTGMLFLLFISCSNEPENQRNIYNDRSSSDSQIEIRKETEFATFFDGVWYPIKFDPLYVENSIRNNINIVDFSWGRALHYKDLSTGYPQYDGVIIDVSKKSYSLGSYLENPGDWDKVVVDSLSDQKLSLSYPTGEKIVFNRLNENEVAFIKIFNNREIININLFRVSGPLNVGVIWEEGNFNPVRAYEAYIKEIERSQN